jgi:hypothetical protein
VDLRRSDIARDLAVRAGVKREQAPIREHEAIDGRKRLVAVEHRFDDFLIYEFRTE